MVTTNPNIQTHFVRGFQDTLFIYICMKIEAAETIGFVYSVQVVLDF